MPGRSRGMRGRRNETAGTKQTRTTKHASEEGADSSAGRCHMGAGGSREQRTAGMRGGRKRVRDRLDSRGEEDVAAVALQDALRWPIACRGSVLMLAQIGKALLGDPGRHARELLL